MTDLAAGSRAVLVTGGAHGIGAAIVRRFASAGHQVLIADADAGLAEATGARFHHADVSGFADNEAAVTAAVAHFGGLDVVCLDAGVPGGAGIGEDIDPDRYRRGIQVNLDGVVYGANAALPALRERGGGAIVVTSSLAGVAPSADLYYSAAKHALIGFVRSLALLVRGDGITVNAVCPGFIRYAAGDGVPRQPPRSRTGRRRTRPRCRGGVGHPGRRRDRTGMAGSGRAVSDRCSIPGHHSQSAHRTACGQGGFHTSATC